MGRGSDHVHQQNSSTPANDNYNDNEDKGWLNRMWNNYVDRSPSILAIVSFGYVMSVFSLFGTRELIFSMMAIFVFILITLTEGLRIAKTLMSSTSYKENLYLWICITLGAIALTQLTTATLSTRGIEHNKFQDAFVKESMNAIVPVIFRERVFEPKSKEDTSEWTGNQWTLMASHEDEASVIKVSFGSAGRCRDLMTKVRPYTSTLSKVEFANGETFLHWPSPKTFLSECDQDITFTFDKTLPLR